MSPSNESGHPPRAGDGAGAPDGSPDTARTGSESKPGSPAPRGAGAPAGPARSHAAEHGEIPPWQRGPASRARTQQQTPDTPPPADRGAAAGLDARLNRFIAGAPASAASPEAVSAPRAERTEGARTEVARAEVPRAAEVTRIEAPRADGNAAAYRSELPDLSDAPPRPVPPRQPDRPIPEPAAKPPAPGPAPGRGVQVGVRQHKGPVRASMQIRRIDPWSALKVSSVLSVALFFVWMIAVAFLYLVLGGMGVWSKLNSNVGDLLTSASGSAGGELVSSGTIFGGAALIGLVNIVLLTAAATIGTFIYNLTTDLVGGVEVTLADRD
ncbi:MAG: DUF3566 domain-containing protein [Mycolicibacterium sp.]|uniref:DUF3566 domain-containing protein n=1 Tax=Mycolicibacterium sp. TaxID=2320850 RepID=UPI003D09CEBB